MFFYAIDRPITPVQFRDLLVRSTLGQRRPIDDMEALQGMVENATLTATCWLGDVLAGVARSVTDFHYCCYLSDLAVDEAYQRQGIGRELVALTQSQLGPRCSLILLAAPAAAAYYEPLGFCHHPRAWVLPAGQKVHPRGGEGRA